MDDVPTELIVNGVKGRRFKHNRYYSGMDSMFALDVTYRFNLKDLIKAGAARTYPLPPREEKQSSPGTRKSEVE